MLRAILPIYNHNHLFGMLIINIKYELFLKKLLFSLDNTKNIFISNQNKDYMQFNAKKNKFFFHFHEGAKQLTPSYILQAIASPDTQGYFAQHENINYFIKYFPDKNVLKHYMVIILQVPENTLLEKIMPIRDQNILLAFFIIIVILILSALLSRKITNPLRQLTAQISHVDGKNKKFKFLIKQKNEIGLLAKAFENLINRVLDEHSQTQAILENIGDGVISINKNGDIETFNPACEKIFGYNAKEVLGENVKMLMSDSSLSKHDKDIENYFTLHNKTKLGVTRELIGLHKNGQDIPIQLIISEAILQDGSAIICCAIRDISEQKRLALEREALIRKLSNINTELDSFAHIASHDLKEPLRGIYNHATFLYEDYQDRLDDEGIKRLNRLTFLAKRMDGLITDLLNLSKIGTDNMTREMVDSHQIVEDIKEILQTSINEKNVFLKINDDLPTLMCNAAQLAIIFRNLINNAIKYNDKPKKMIEIGVLASNDTTFFIKDNGIGIASDFHHDIFKIFKRLHTSEQFAEEGTGSGLTFVKKIIEKNGGKIWLESTPGEGTIFYFTLDSAKE